MEDTLEVVRVDSVITDELIEVVGVWVSVDIVDGVDDDSVEVIPGSGTVVGPVGAGKEAQKSSHGWKSG